MKKTYILTVDYNEEGEDLLEKLNITADHARDLIDFAENEARAKNEGTLNKPFDSFESLVDKMDNSSFNGNEMMFFLINGYTISMKMQMAKKQALAELLGGLF